jgi:hypothetical protein
MMRYVLVLSLGIALGVFGARSAGGVTRGAASPPVAQGDSAAAVAGIVALHHADSVATISGEPRELRELWDSAAVRIAPGGPATVTRAAIFAEDSAFHAGHMTRHITLYAPHYGAPVVAGNMAVEWGYADVQVIAKPGDTPASGRINVLRVLRRQPDGAWKFTHVILNSAK